MGIFRNAKTRAHMNLERRAARTVSLAQFDCYKLVYAYLSEAGDQSRTLCLISTLNSSLFIS